MSIQRRPPTGTKLKKGEKVRWIVRYRDPAGREHSRTFDRQDDAKDFDADQATKLARGTWIDPADEKTTVANLVDEWVDQAHNPGTKGVRAGFRANLGDLAHMPIGKVRPSHVTAWVNTLRTGRPWKGGQPLADITVEMHLGRLKGIFHRAVEDGLVGRTPIPSTLRKSAMVDKRVDDRAVPTPKQVKMMCAAAEEGGALPDGGMVNGRVKLCPSPWLAMAIRLGADTGLRVGEVAGLVWSDVDLDGRSVTVRRQCIRRAGDYSALKTRRSRRVVPLSTPMSRELSEWVRGEDDPVVPGPSGRGVSSQRMVAWMRMVSEVSGLDARVCRFHGLRHLYASSLLAAGEPITTVAALIGDTVQTTSGTYAHWLPGAQDAARASINAAAGLVRDDVPSLRVVGND